MVRYAAAFGLLIATAAPAFAWDCPARQTIYEAAEGDGVLKVSGMNLEITSGGHTVIYGTSGNPGAAVRTARRTDDPDARALRYFKIDLARIADADEPDHIMVFDEAVYWPVCKP